MPIKRMNFLLMSIAIAAVTLSFTCISAGAQATKIQRRVKLTANDALAARDAAASSFHARAARIPGAYAIVKKSNRPATQRPQPRSNSLSAFDRLDDIETDPPDTRLPYYPSDLQYGGGPVLKTSTQHAVYINLSGSVASNWGDPERFLSDIDNTQFGDILDQYIHSTADNRYPVGGNLVIDVTPDNTSVPNEISLTQVFEIVHAAAVMYGAGGQHTYHVFLPAGTETCIEGTSPLECYSPDSRGNWAFCAYHGWVEFVDVGVVLFTMEPFQDVPGCEEAPPNPNGPVADSTYGALGHEYFETITDPLGTGWTNMRNDSDLGAEIGDECEIVADAFLQIPDPSFKINGKMYQTQAEYSNKSHYCSKMQ